MADIYEFVRGELAKACKIDVSLITPGTDLFNDLGIDSFAILSIAYAIEDHLNVRVPVGDWMSNVNTGDSVSMEQFRMDNFVAAIAHLVKQQSVA
jgi:acyl carrier protein